MTALLEQAIKSVKSLPACRQDEIAHDILAWLDDGIDSPEISAADVAAIKEGLSQLDRGDFYSEKQFRDLLKSF
jgi:predicted transcriptional regulator